MQKIKKFLIRLTHKEDQTPEWNSRNENFKNWTFLQFLFEVGMFDQIKGCVDDYSEEEKKKALVRYLDALSASIRGSGSVYMRRGMMDLLTNNFNTRLLSVHEANHDLQIVVDQVFIIHIICSSNQNIFQYACAQYVVGYLTKNEAGMSNLLKAINDQAGDISNMELLDQLASALDRNREVSVQESIYRLLGLKMTKSTVRIKYVSTVHPHYRDGLLKGVENL